MRFSLPVKPAEPGWPKQKATPSRLARLLGRQDLHIGHKHLALGFRPRQQ